MIWGNLKFDTCILTDVGVHAMVVVSSKVSKVTRGIFSKTRTERPEQVNSRIFRVESGKKKYMKYAVKMVQSQGNKFLLSLVLLIRQQSAFNITISSTQFVTEGFYCLEFINLQVHFITGFMTCVTVKFRLLLYRDTLDKMSD